MSVLSGVLMLVLGLVIGAMAMQAYAMKLAKEMDEFYNTELDKIRTAVEEKIKEVSG